MVYFRGRISSLEENWVVNSGHSCFITRSCHLPVVTLGKSPSIPVASLRCYIRIVLPSQADDEHEVRSCLYKARPNVWHTEVLR